jgi:penicillin amidase
LNYETSKRFRLLASALSVLALLAVIAVGWIYSRIRASLPQLDGTAVITSLQAKATVERDALGVPTIQAENRTDLARALGFLHAQDRYFQMDVWRRAAAGELSAVFGRKTLPHDRAMRQHGFRQLAQATIAQLPPAEKAVLYAYTDGVNAGLAALREKPFEYLVVRAEPQPWKPEDTILVADAMLVDLQDDTGRYGQTLTSLRDEFGASGLAAFAPLLTSADAALDGSVGSGVVLPGPEVIDLRRGGTKAPEATAAADRAGFAPAANFTWGGEINRAAAPFSFLDREPDMHPGSNAYALAGTHTATGAALLASDIHLNLRVPNAWYRAAFRYPGHAVTGITLPGVPVMVAGSNGHVAWSFTVAYADTGDLITVDMNPLAPSLYRVPGQTDLQKIEHRRETIEVQGEKAETVDYDWTIWGPIVGRDEQRHALAYLWTGHDPAATNLSLLQMEDATDVRTAIDILHRVGMPCLNAVVADSGGNIAWTVTGKLPRRVGFDGRLPVTFQYADRRWDGYVPPDEVPTWTTAPTGHAHEATVTSGRIWSSNQRMVGGEMLQLLGDGGYARPNRARQGRDAIAQLEHATPRDLLAVQLDDRALFLEPWHALLLKTLSPQVTAEKKVRAALRGYVEKWEGHASVDAVCYPIVRQFRIAVYTRMFQPIFRGCAESNPQFNWGQLLLEDAAWTILKEKPVHLLEPQYASWDALLVAAVDDVITELDRSGVRLPHATWGQRNRAELRHPFSYTLPWFVRSTLDMPPDPLPGDTDMPRVQSPTHGASERFVVSPGREDEGIFEMPCGQSGHPLSPYYRAGHEAWVKGDPAPFLPRQTEHTLVLEPSH